MKFPNPKNIIDGLGDSVLTIVEILPRTGQNVARVLDNYAGQADSHIKEVKSQMPEEPGAVPQALFGAIGETIGAGIGVVEGFIKAGTDTISEVKGNIDRAMQS